MTWERSQTNYLQQYKQWTVSLRVYEGDPERQKGALKYVLELQLLGDLYLGKIILPQRDITFGDGCSSICN